MKQKTNAEKVAIIREVARIVNGTVREDYSGRGMYGEECMGIDCEEPSIACEEAAILGLRGAQEDNMGCDYIIYWPSVKSEKAKWEIGAAFQRLLGFGYETETIARKLGYKERYVKESLELSDVPEEIKSLLSQQAVTPSLALSEIRKHGPRGATLTLRAAVAAQPAQKNGKHPVAAKRAKKSAGCSLSAEDAQLIVEALKLAAIQTDKTLSDAAEKSLEIFATKGIKPE